MPKIANRETTRTHRTGARGRTRVWRALAGGVWTVAAIGLLAGYSFAHTKARSAEGKKKGATAMKIEIRSSVFDEGGTIPKEYTADGKDESPPLNWSAGPDRTASFALICEDPDAPRKTWVHWVLFNLPADLRVLPEGGEAANNLPKGAVQGKNDFGKLGYGGPAPPPGKPHRYVFHLYALDKRLDLPPGTTKDQLQAAIKGHILAEGQLAGKYGREGK